MLDLWLSPVPVDSIIQDESRDDFPLLSQVKVYDSLGQMPSLEETQVAFIGWDDTSHLIRRELYRLEWYFEGLECADLGTIRNVKDDHSFTQLLTELIDGEIIPVIIGSEAVKALPQFLAHKGLKKYSNIGVISESLSLEYVDTLLSTQGDAIFNVGCIGYQTYFCSPTRLSWLTENNYDGIRLGDVKANIEEAEPIIRDVDMVFFQLDALRGADAMGVKRPSPNGLRANEACQLARYAGMSDKLGSFSISGFYPEHDVHHLTAQIIAQMIWYFIDGVYHRKQDYPVSVTEMTEYMVSLASSKDSITFWKSNKSGRWWMQIPNHSQEDLERHHLVPCSYKDYQLASAGKLPERLIHILQRL